MLDLRVTAPPVDGAANKACIELIAKHFGIRKSQISLVSGTTSRTKVFEIDGLENNLIWEKDC